MLILRSASALLTPLRADEPRIDTSEISALTFSQRQSAGSLASAVYGGSVRCLWWLLNLQC